MTTYGTLRQEMPVEFVESFTDHFTAWSDDADSRGLTAYTQNVLREEHQIVNGTGSVAVRGDFPWSYRYTFTIEKDALESMQESVRENMESMGADEERIEGMINGKYNLEEQVRTLAMDVLTDGNATPHKMSFNSDYEARVEIIEFEDSYKGMIAWEPVDSEEGSEEADSEGDSEEESASDQSTVYAAD